MGIFGNQAERLLRERWATPKELAEEIYAIISADVPLQIAGPVTITNDGPGPALKINQDNGFSGGAISVTRPGTTPVVAPNNTNNETPPPRTTDPLGEPTKEPPPTPPKPVGGPGVPGKVTGGGPGQGPYDVTIYPDGLSGEGVDVKVLQLEIDSGETIPPGTWAVVVQTSDQSYYMQVAVWLAG